MNTYCGNESQAEDVVGQDRKEKVMKIYIGFCMDVTAKGQEWLSDLKHDFVKSV